MYSIREQGGFCDNLATNASELPEKACTGAVPQVALLVPTHRRNYHPAQLHYLDRLQRPQEGIPQKVAVAAFELGHKGIGII